MKKSKKKKKSLSRGRKERKIQSEKLQKRVKLGQERSQGKMRNILKGSIDVPNWYPKDGSHIIDVVPYIAGKYDPLSEKGDPTYTFECWVHTRVGPNEGMYLCPTEMYNEPCPICEHRQKLREEGADEKVWKKLFPKRRNLYNIICYDKGEEKKGIQIWDISYHYFEKQVLAISKKPSRHGGEDKLINFADTEEGRSVSFTVEPAKSKNDYPSYIGHSFDERDYEIDEELLDAAVTLDEVVERPSYKEIDEAYWDEKDKKKRSRSRDEEEDEDLEDMDKDELKEFIEEHDLDIKVKRKDDEDDIREKIVEALKDKDGEEENDESLEDLLDDLEDIEDREDLEEFIEEHDLDIKIKKKDDEDDIKDKIIEALEDEFDED